MNRFSEHGFVWSITFAPMIILLENEMAQIHSEIETPAT